MRKIFFAGLILLFTAFPAYALEGVLYFNNGANLAYTNIADEGDFIVVKTTGGQKEKYFKKDIDLAKSLNAVLLGVVKGGDAAEAPKNTGDAQKTAAPVQVVQGAVIFAPGNVYQIYITRQDTNVYKIEGSNSFLTTRMCLEPASGEEAILKYDTRYGNSKGKLIILHSGASYDIEDVY